MVRRAGSGARRAHRVGNRIPDGHALLAVYLEAGLDALGYSLDGEQDWL
jgi:hypothetical protein